MLSILVAELTRRVRELESRVVATPKPTPRAALLSSSSSSQNELNAEIANLKRKLNKKCPPSIGQSASYVDFNRIICVEMCFFVCACVCVIDVMQMER
jgi:hypothetical protein